MIVQKRCRRCGKGLVADTEAKFCVCPHPRCRALMTITRTLSVGTKSDNRHGIRLWVMR